MLNYCIRAFVSFFIIIVPFAQAEFSDKIITPHLGPYKLEKSHIGECPNSLTIIAECSLSQLALKNTKELYFDFVTFKGINSGEMMTTIGDSLVEKNLTVMDKLTITSKRSKYMDRFKAWFSETVELELNIKKFTVKKFQMDMKNEHSKVTLNCSYVFDENERMLDSFSK